MRLELYTKENIENLSKTGIYKITCLYNNKIYVGSASGIKGHSKNHKGFYGRWTNHIYKLKSNKHRNSHLQNAWNKYGDENFRFQILEFCEPENCSKIEEEWIDKLQSYDHSKGFNLLRRSLCNNIDRSIETRTKISNQLSGRSRPGLNSHLKVPVLQYDSNNNLVAEFESISDASKHTPCMRQAIYKCCIGVYKTSNGFIWKYKNENHTPIKSATYNKKVYKYTLENELVNVYNSIISCSTDMNYNRGTIRSYLNSEKPINNQFYLKTNLLGALGEDYC